MSARRAAAVVLVIGGAVAGCGSASGLTPEEAFVAEVRAAGIWPVDSDADLLANEPCPALENAHDRDGVAGVVEQIDWQADDPEFLAEYLIYAGAAVKHLCPGLREAWRAAVDLHEDGEFSAR